MLLQLSKSNIQVLLVVLTYMELPKCSVYHYTILCLIPPLLCSELKVNNPMSLRHYLLFTLYLMV